LRLITSSNFVGRSETLGSDKLIQHAISEMHIRTNTDPWGGEGQYVEDLDLVAFFTFVRENRVDFFHTSIEAVAKRVREAGVR